MTLIALLRHPFTAWRDGEASKMLSMYEGFRRLLPFIIVSAVFDRYALWLSGGGSISEYSSPMVIAFLPLFLVARVLSGAAAYLVSVQFARMTLVRLGMYDHATSTVSVVTFSFIPMYGAVAVQQLPVAGAIAPLFIMMTLMLQYAGARFLGKPYGRNTLLVFSTLFGTWFISWAFVEILFYEVMLSCIGYPM